MKARSPINTNRSPLPAALTPLHIHARGVALDAAERDLVRERMGSRLGKFAPAIEKATVRFENSEDEVGVHDTLCRVKVYFSDDLPTVVIDQHGHTPREALKGASTAVERTVRSTLARSKKHPPKEEAKVPERLELLPRGAARNPLGTEGGTIGRRVGQGRENVLRTLASKRKPQVDTSAPGVSATDRRAGGGSTASRNVRKTAKAGMTSSLEDSTTGKPSRKSTRKSADSTKRDSNLKQRTTRKIASAKARARRSAAGNKRVRGRRG